MWIRSCAVAASAIGALAFSSLPANATAPSLSIHVSKTRVISGTAERFTGHLSGHHARGRTVVLQQLGSKRWRDLATRHTDSQGNYKIRWVPANGGKPTFRVYAPQTRSAPIVLSDPVKITVLEWHWLEDETAVDGGVCHGSFEVNGRTYPHSLCYSPGNGEFVEYNLARKCTTLSTAVGLADSSPSDSNVTMEVAADGNQLYSQTFQLGQSQQVSLRINGNLRLHLDVVYNSRGNFITPVWGNAEILCSF